jgi:tetratricopeptide (TPR) repeat protein
MGDHTEEAKKEFAETLENTTRTITRPGEYFGLIAMDLGNRPEAIRHFEAALKLNPADEMSKQALSDLTHPSPTRSTP